jgi:protein arginine N-methyltransferase 1
LTPLAAARRRLLALPHRAAESRAGRRLIYEVRNRRVFSDLYQHDRMLHDRVRVDAYVAGIEKHVRPGDVVADLGTGSGVLAFLAARAGASTVHAIEHGQIIEAAEAGARANGIENVRFHRTHSQRFDPGERVDVLLHEQIGDAAFDERVIDNIADLRDRVLKPGGRILPGRLGLYIAPVELDEPFRGPYAWQQTDLHGLDFSALRSLAPAQGHGYRYRLFRPFPLGRILAEPEPVAIVDLHTARPGDLPTTFTYERPVTTAGKLDGFCVWFAAWFDDDLSFTSSPLDPPTSWATPLLRVATRSVAAGDTLRFELRAGDLAAPETWDWDD